MTPRQQTCQIKSKIASPICRIISGSKEKTDVPTADRRKTHGNTSHTTTTRYSNVEQLGSQLRAKKNFPGHNREYAEKQLQPYKSIDNERQHDPQYESVMTQPETTRTTLKTEKQFVGS